MMKSFPVRLFSLVVAVSLDFVLGSKKMIPDESVPSDEVTIYFIRHAQSEWNENKAKNAERKRKKKENHAEGKKMPKFENDKKDSPLSDQGIEQVTTLRNWFRDKLNGCREECTPCAKNAAMCLARSLPAKKGSTSISTSEQQLEAYFDDSATQSCEDNELKSLIQNHFDQIVFATSNLKRAIETMLVFFSGIVEGLGEATLTETKPEIHIVSALQETSLGTDAASSLPASISPFEHTFKQGYDANYKRALDKFKNHGQKTLLPFSFNVAANVGNLNGWTSSYSRRYGQFCDWVASQSSSGDDRRRVFVISGHSSWLLGFFIKYLGHGNSFGDDNAFDKSTNLAEKILRFGRSNWQEIRHKLSPNSYKAMELKLGNASMIKFKLKITRKVPSWRNGWKGNQYEIKKHSAQLLFGDWQVAGSCKDTPSCEKLQHYLTAAIPNTASQSSIDLTMCQINRLQEND